MAPPAKRPAPRPHGKPQPKQPTVQQQQWQQIQDDLLKDPPGPADKGWVPQMNILRTRNSARSERGLGNSVYDSHLKFNGADNLELTLVLRIFFMRIDPSPRGGYRDVGLDGNGVMYKLEEISDQELADFRKEACRQANEVWNGGLCLVTPNDFVGFDWPSHANGKASVGMPHFGGPTPNLAVNFDMSRLDDGRAVRPNVNCSLRVEATENFAASHTTVFLMAPSHPKDFVSYCSQSARGNTWDIHDTGVHRKTVKQDPAFLSTFFGEKIGQRMVPHEVGHLLGLEHIGLHLKVGQCVYQSDQCSREEASGGQYGNRANLPMWFGRDIMGLGSVVHACNAAPWMAAMSQHVRECSSPWIPAGVRIPPRRVKDIPSIPYTLQNSPYQGGFQEVGKY